MKYQLLLKDVLRYTEKAGLVKEADQLRKAVHVMHVVPKAANDMMCVGRLQGFDGKITAQGKLLMQGKASCPVLKRQCFYFKNRFSYRCLARW